MRAVHSSVDASRTERRGNSLGGDDGDDDDDDDEHGQRKRKKGGGGSPRGANTSKLKGEARKAEAAASVDGDSSSSAAVLSTFAYSSKVADILAGWMQKFQGKVRSPLLTCHHPTTLSPPSLSPPFSPPSRRLAALGADWPHPRFADPRRAAQVGLRPRRGRPPPDRHRRARRQA